MSRPEDSFVSGVNEPERYNEIVRSRRPHLDSEALEAAARALDGLVWSAAQANRSASAEEDAETAIRAYLEALSASKPNDEGVKGAADCPFCGMALVWSTDADAWVHPATEEDATDLGEPRCIMSAYMVRNRPQSLARWNRRSALVPPPSQEASEAAMTLTDDIATNPLSFETRSHINGVFQALLEVEEARGKHGRYESIFRSMHRAYAPYVAAPAPPTEKGDEVLEVREFVGAAWYPATETEWVRFYPSNRRPPTAEERLPAHSEKGE